MVVVLDTVIRVVHFWLHNEGSTKMCRYGYAPFVFLRTYIAMLFPWCCLFRVWRRCLKPWPYTNSAAQLGDIIIRRRDLLVLFPVIVVTIIDSFWAPGLLAMLFFAVAVGPLFSVGARIRIPPPPEVELPGSELPSIQEEPGEGGAGLAEASTRRPSEEMGRAHGPGLASVEPAPFGSEEPGSLEPGVARERGASSMDAGRRPSAELGHGDLPGRRSAEMAPSSLHKDTKELKQPLLHND